MYHAVAAGVGEAAGASITQGTAVIGEATVEVELRRSSAVLGPRRRFEAIAIEIASLPQLDVVAAYRQRLLRIVVAGVAAGVAGPLADGEGGQDCREKRCEGCLHDCDICFRCVCLIDAVKYLDTEPINEIVMREVEGRWSCGRLFISKVLK